MNAKNRMSIMDTMNIWYIMHKMIVMNKMNQINILNTMVGTMNLMSIMNKINQMNILNAMVRTMNIWAYRTQWIKWTSERYEYILINMNMCRLWTLRDKHFKSIMNFMINTVVTERFRCYNVYIIGIICYMLISVGKF